MPNFLRGGLKEGYVKMSPYGPCRRRARRRKKADEVKAAMLKGDYVIFTGGLKDNKGATVDPGRQGLRADRTASSRR